MGTHPRSRGENAVHATTSSTVSGSSPLTRGNDEGGPPARGLLPGGLATTLICRIIPAHTGIHNPDELAPARTDSSPLT